jgi:hypothetical protein
MAADGLVIEAGDTVQVEGVSWRVASVSDGPVVTFECVLVGAPKTETVALATPAVSQTPSGLVEPDVLIVDGPPLPGQEDDLRPIGFAFADPWTGPVRFMAGVDPTTLSQRGVVERPCTIGQLVSPLYPHVSGQWQDASVWVRVGGGLLRPELPRLY